MDQGEQAAPPEAGGLPPVVATYREIALHFGLRSGPDAGRLKAKRAGWPIVPGNHPSDPARVRVPRAAWDAAVIPRVHALTNGARPALMNETNPGARSDQTPGDQQPIPNGLNGLNPGAQTNHEPPAVLPRLDALAAQLAALLARMEAGTAEELVRLRDRLAQVEAERDQAREQAREDRARLTKAEGAAREARDTLAWWTAGGPLRRAWRALLHRPAR